MLGWVVPPQHYFFKIFKHEKSGPRPAFLFCCIIYDLRVEVEVGVYYTNFHYSPSGSGRLWLAPVNPPLPTSKVERLTIHYHIEHERNGPHRDKNVCYVEYREIDQRKVEKVDHIIIAHPVDQIA